jgi:hypothetical protein
MDLPSDSNAEKILYYSGPPVKAKKNLLTTATADIDMYTAAKDCE